MRRMKLLTYVQLETLLEGKGNTKKACCNTSLQNISWNAENITDIQVLAHSMFISLNSIIGTIF